VGVSRRHQLILERLTATSRQSVVELAKATGCSEMTMRRDLEALERAGALQRVHGGAVLASFSAVEPPFAVRALVNQDGKRLLAQACASMLRDGESVVLDSGTTAVEVARAVVHLKLMIAPLSARVLAEVLRTDQHEVLVPGGTIRPVEQSFVGELAERAFDLVRFDTMVLSCCGLDAAHGATAHSLDDVRVKRAALAASRRVLVVASEDKLGRVALGRVCPVDAIDVILTDAAETSEHVAELRDAGTRVVVVGPPGDRG
jgi:DeoR/GlpR family transcriptional regulator of sugar metabolism